MATVTVRTLRYLPKVIDSILVSLAVGAIIAMATLVVIPRALGWQGFIVLTGSMEPSLGAGDLSFIEKNIEPDSLVVGDIVTFHSSAGSLTTHRITRVEVDASGMRSFEVKGDANDEPDPELVLASQIIGKVQGHLPYFGRLVLGLRNFNHLHWFLWPMAGIVVLGEARQLRSILRR